MTASPTAKLISITPNVEELLKAACSKPYGKNCSMRVIQEHIIASGHLSVLEHCYASFEVECSVAVLGQLTRHRHLSFTCQSARGCEFDEMIMPDSFKENGEDILNFETAMSNYQEALEVGYSPEDARYLLPQGVKTKIVVTGNFRAWYEYFPKRLCRRAMPEHRKVAEAILKELKEACPVIFDRNFMNCGVNCKEKGCEFK